MPPARSSSTKALESNRPRRVSTQKAKKPSKQRKVPKGLAEIMSFCHYGVKSHDLFNGDATATTAPSPAASESVTPATSQDTPYGTPYPPSYFPLVLPSPNSQIPVWDLDNATRVNMFCGTEVIPSHGPYQNEVAQTADNMSNNLFQSYGRYPDSHLIPVPSSTGSLSMGYDDQPSQHWCPDLYAQYSIPHSTSSYVSNAPMTFTPTLLNDMYGETSTGSSHSAMIFNDGTTSPFPNDDARHHLYYYT